MSATFVFEIGVEEIPATVVLPALEQLRDGLQTALERARLGFNAVRAVGTPRRLVVVVDGLAERQEDAVVEHKGPPAAQAFDENGNPTKAALGFAKARGVAVEDLEVRETDRGKFVFARVVQPGRPAAEVLCEILPPLVSGLSFPKTMRWGDGDFRFCRPIRWLLALLGDQVVPVELADLRADRFTHGHRCRGNPRLSVPSADEYFDILRAEMVIVDHNERRQRLVEAAQKAAASVGGRPRLHDDLVQEVTFMVEHPAGLVGSFDERFLDLPEAVVVKVLEGHQRFFAVESQAGRLLPHFVSIRDGADRGLENVRRGNEWVVQARLEDAEFYMHEDLKTPFAERVELLDGITFMAGLGTMRQKTARLVQLVDWLAKQVGVDQRSLTAARRAAELSKCDLTTMMIADTKLGELQGVIGAEYARRSGEPDDVCQAIAEQYRPRTAGDAPPASAAGRLLASADRLDNLAACYALGLRPSGSADPYALRRQMQGLVTIALDGSMSYPVADAFAAAYDLVAADAQRDIEPREDVVDGLMQLAAQRVEAALQDAGVRYDICRAVNAASWRNFVEAWQRGMLLAERAKADDEWEHVVLSAQRIANILRPAADQAAEAVDETLLREDGERKLWQAVQRASAQVDDARRRGQFDRIWQALVELAPVIDEFFDEVMVMAEDRSLRANRLALLADAERVFMALADFREIVLD